MFALNVQQVSKTFHTPSKVLKANQNISLMIEEGKIYGLLGPNGAGKSTLINLISGVLLPDPGSGVIEIFGVDVVKHPLDAKHLLGVVPQEIVIEPAFTVEEVLYFFSGMYGVSVAQRKERILDILEALDLSDKLHERARNLSGGMKRRLMIAKALIHQPKLLILDEPTAGVDVALRQKIWKLVRRLNQEGTTIIFTTHYLEEAEELCEAMTVINHGQVIKEGIVKDIQQEFSKNLITFELYHHEVEQLSGVKRQGVEYEYTTSHLTQDMQKILQHYGDNLKSIKNESASLEKIFLELTNS